MKPLLALLLVTSCAYSVNLTGGPAPNDPPWCPDSQDQVDMQAGVALTFPDGNGGPLAPPVWFFPTNTVSDLDPTLNCYICGDADQTTITRDNKPCSQDTTRSVAPPGAPIVPTAPIVVCVQAAFSGCHPPQ